MGRSAPGRKAALLLPLTGNAAGTGRVLADAAALAYPAGEGERLIVLDTGGTPEGAAAAANRALAAGAQMLVGPLFGREVTPVVTAVATRVPVLALTNDRDAGAGSFVMGVTPSQTVSAVLAYARGQGVRTVALIAGDGSWARQAIEAGREVANRVGLSLRVSPPSASLTTTDALSAANGGELPNAVLLAENDPPSQAIGARLNAAGVQLLGTSLWIENPGSFADLDGAWLAAPPTDRVADFAAAYQARFGRAPGAIAGVAYDAAMIARTVLDAGGDARAGLTRDQGFDGVTGHLRFGADGRCARTLTLFVIENGALRPRDVVEGR